MFHQFYGRDLVSIDDLTKEEIIYILKTSSNYKNKLLKLDALKGNLLASCFFEPSTRTRFSFESAMLRLGGNVMGFSDPLTTAIKKGETLYDTMKMVENYADIIVLRHPHDGAARWAAECVNIPVINAGDGSNEHPTQTLTDLFTIQESQGMLDYLSIGIVGDLRYGRTAHSLAKAAVHFGFRLYFVSPQMLEMPKEVCDFLKEKGVKFSFHRQMEEILNKIDILYMTRIQEERFNDKLEFQRLKNSYHLNIKHLDNIKETMRIMHPLPRNKEVDISIDKTKYAIYFQQAENALYVRQALMSMLLNKEAYAN